MRVVRLQLQKFSGIDFKHFIGVFLLKRTPEKTICNNSHLKTGFPQQIKFEACACF